MPPKASKELKSAEEEPKEARRVTRASSKLQENQPVSVSSKQEKNHEDLSAIPEDSQIEEIDKAEAPLEATDSQMEEIEKAEAPPEATDSTTQEEDQTKVRDVTHDGPSANSS